ncbi:tRNA (guanosine(37)-N1)-methyltransferase TrmD [Halioglobus japonicus]|uniref:tRNA (guanine-N(1)-)-methyltransferase n=1 Tax=Halioglobus japonicus TaxID=930805 RepID=A0AAP8MHR6_9GAMM|nr:tRNA (guanosine(37)-N1)-methyltransferase TrmD [Halioglobus japonicus]AQA19349.1 tRNA (guanosine(37)-N1)-methyltransferase TrmD [Halioglobus japonicus]PLW87604.1 tRNA (guanosine(37)-N1)-methyltransferase TrmD [Halioglobus japonicus]GHD07594.1 tRNA (guanine-N(1)-)-methyltransferase [Halioglobus japonicus]
MHIALVSLFPEMFEAVTDHGVTGRAVKQGLVTISHSNPRDFTTDKHRTVDDRPYGGGPGMLMKIDPLQQAIAAAREAAGVDARVIYLSPQGKRLDHGKSVALSQEQALILVAGRYEGVDERLIEAEVDEEISIGDYVLSGGELAAMVVIDSVTRHLPGVLGHELSAQEDSYADGLLDCPHYTRPEEYQGKPVPEVLLSGNHEWIRRWRLKQALGRTYERRPDLLEGRANTAEEDELLAEYLRERE